MDTVKKGHILSSSDKQQKCLKLSKVVSFLPVFRHETTDEESLSGTPVIRVASTDTGIA
jgi:hypothetical protein